MKLYGINYLELSCIVEDVSDEKYEGNLRLTRESQQRNTHVNFRLRVLNSSGPGAHRSASGRRTVSACWHAHFDVMQAVFVRNPEAKLVTALARYDGVEQFLAKYRETGYRQVGSIMQPASYGDLCDCEQRISDQPSRDALERLKVSKAERMASAGSKRIRRARWRAVGAGL